MPIPDPTCQRGLKTLSQELLKAQESMQEPTNKKPRVEEKLSEKQKARRMMEEKRKADVLKAKEERKRNIEMLKHDKLVRETDPNWKPGVSAACAKSGTGLKSFRDRHGE